MTRFAQFLVVTATAMYIWGVGFDGPDTVEGAKPKGRVSLIIAGEKGAPITSYQSWSKDLGEAGVRNVRIRAARKSDKIEIKSRGTDQMPFYDVLGMIQTGGDLVLPGARFRPGDADGVAAWVKDLAENGPRESREPTGVFGLTKSQFDRVMKDLGKVVNFSTVAETRAAVLDRVAAQLELPLSIEPRLKATLAQDTVENELAGFSSGTVLAYVLRPLELGFVPTEIKGGGLKYVVVSLGADDATESGKDEDAKQWSVGWLPSGTKREVLPALFRFHNVSIQNVPLRKVLDAVGEKLKTPILIDRAALTRHGVDLGKVDVTLPAKRTTYGLALRRALSQAKLQYDLRVDDSGKPFIWVTTVRPAFGAKR
ncbi:MAG: hypothetical protein JXM70_10240 [Pirellulales bacterium]|nr:hypothetical protein [Pirellulales bacterium]